MSEGFRLTAYENPAVDDLHAMLSLGQNTIGAGDEDLDLPGEQAGDFIGHYQLIEVLGEGGFGTVWLARQTEPFRRDLALKLIKPGMSSRSIIARFEAERQALAMMDHPNIAAVLDAGATADGRSFFAMELVRGTPITTWCDRRRLPIRDRLELFLAVCHAVQHAHQKGIIHRDLKPSNILVTEIDGRAVPKVIDFGIAKALGTHDLPAFQASGLYTQAGAVIGTPHYMSPEQAGSRQDADTRSDIYTLGVILYELLTGTTPFSRNPASSTLAFDEALRFIREGQVSPPSTYQAGNRAALNATAARCGLDASSYRRMIRGDLDWITAKALDKDRTRRYSSAAAMAEDLQRHLEGATISAVAPSVRDQLVRFARRNRLAIGAAAAITLALLGGTVVSLWQAARATRAQTAAEHSRLLAEEKSKEAEANLQRARSALETYLTGVTEDPKLKQEDFSDLREQLLKSALPLYEEILKTTADPSLRNDEVNALQRLASLYQGQGNYAKAQELLDVAIGKLTSLPPPDAAAITTRRLLVVSYNQLSSVLDEMGNVAEANRYQRIAVDTFPPPENDGERHDLATLLINLGQSHFRNENLPESASVLERAIEMEKTLIADHPEDRTYLGQLSICQSSLGRVLTQAKDYALAEAAFKESVDILKDLSRRDPENQANSWYLSQTYFNYSILLNELGRCSESLPLLTEAIRINHDFSVRFPKQAYYRRLICLGRNASGEAMMKLGRERDAELEFVQAVSIARSLKDQHSIGADYLVLLGAASSRLATLKGNAGQWEAAIPWGVQTVQSFREALAEVPLRISYRRNLLTACTDLAEIYLKAGRPAEAASLAIESTGFFPESWQDWETAAGILARCNTPDRTVLATYRNQAIDFLKKSIALGHPNPARFASLPNLGNLRDLPEFTALLAKPR